MSNQEKLETVRKLMKELKEAKEELKQLQEEPFDTELADNLRKELIKQKTKFEENSRWIEIHRKDPTVPPVAKNGCTKRHVVRDERLVPEEIRKAGGLVYYPEKNEEICHPLPGQTGSCVGDFKVILQISYGKDAPYFPPPKIEETAQEE